MKITLTGPRSVGKSTIGKILAKKLNLKYISADDLMENAMKPYGGLDKAMKCGNIDKIMNRAIPQVKSVMSKDNFIYDLAGGAISSRKHKKYVKPIIKLIKKESIIIGLLPSKNDAEAIKLLFNREKIRKHFLGMDKAELKEKVKKDYFKIKKVLPKVAKKVIYINNRPSDCVADEIFNIIGGDKTLKELK